MNPIPESDPGTRSADVRESDPHLLTALLAFQRSDPTMHQTIADDIRRRHNSATDPAFVAALDHVVTRWAGTLAKLAEGPTGAHNVGASYLDSRPTMDADPIDNDGATTPPSVPAASSPWRTAGDSAAVRLLAAIDASHADVLNDDYPMEMIDAEIRESGGDPDTIADRMAAMVRETIARASSTLSPAPATSGASALTDTESRSLPGLFSAPPPSGVRPLAGVPTADPLAGLSLDLRSRIAAGTEGGPETKRERTARLKAEAKAAAKVKASEADAEAWSTCAQHWQTISGTVPRLSPTEGAGLSLTEAIARDGAAVVVRRFAYLASGPGFWMRRDGAKITAICRTARSEWVVKTDREALDWERDRAAPERAAESTGVVGRSESQNAPERQPAPKQNGSAAWDDMLSVIRSTGGLRLSLGLRGSTLSHDAGEHKRRCQAVADIGGWAKLCEMGEHNRGIIRAQFVAAYDRLGVTA